MKTPKEFYLTAQPLTTKKRPNCCFKATHYEIYPTRMYMNFGHVCFVSILFKKVSLKITNLKSVILKMQE